MKYQKFWCLIPSNQRLSNQIYFKKLHAINERLVVAWRKQVKIFDNFGILQFVRLQSEHSNLQVMRKDFVEISRKMWRRRGKILLCKSKTSTFSPFIFFKLLRAKMTHRKIKSSVIVNQQTMNRLKRFVDPKHKKWMWWHQK